MQYFRLVYFFHSKTKIYFFIHHNLFLNLSLLNKWLSFNCLIEKRLQRTTTFKLSGFQKVASRMISDAISTFLIEVLLNLTRHHVFLEEKEPREAFLWAKQMKWERLLDQMVLKPPNSQDFRRESICRPSCFFERDH